MSLPPLLRAQHLKNVRYEIRGPLARRAGELEREGHSIIKINVGNPAPFGFRTPEPIRKAFVEHLEHAEGYSHQKGIMPAREAVAADARARGFGDVTAEDVFMGNGCSELILMCLEALCEPGAEVLVPAPDYPLWTAAVTLAGGKAVHYPCRPENGFVPDPDEVAALMTERTRAMVVINPNNPTGSVSPREVLERLVRLAEARGLVLFADEIYDRILYDGAEHVPLATLCKDTLCGTFGGLSKVHRACGYRTGWITFTGKKDHAKDYLDAVELLSSLRLCANVPGQYTVAAAITADRSIYELTSETGRLGVQRRALLGGVARSKYLEVVTPKGAMYAFPGVKKEALASALPGFDDATFAMSLLEREHVLLVPGSGFNVPYRHHFRLTLLPDEATMREVFVRLERELDRQAGRA